MTMPAESPAGTPSAQVVGNAFVEQYYHILHKSPELVFRFYQDTSVLSRPDSNGVMTSVMTMQGINDKILSLNYKDYIAEIKTADAQQSFEEGVIVLVTGYLTGKDNVKKKFAQSFFLAPQEKGFFVLNDVFRYVDDDASVETIPVSANGTTENVQAAPPPPPPEPEQPPHVPHQPPHVAHQPPHVPQQPPHVPHQPPRVPQQPPHVPHQPEVPESSVEDDLTYEAEVCDPSENEDGSITEEEIVDPPAQLNQSETVPVTSVPSASQDDGPKMTYASILKAMKANPSPIPAKKPKAPSSDIKAKLPSSDQGAVGSVKPSPVHEASASTRETGTEKTDNADQEAEGHSIYVRNLPQNATAAQLEEVFTNFGPIKQGGVQVRSNKQGFCFGFVEFESLTSMRSAIEASPITIGNRDAFVEEKRTTTRVSGGATTNSGRGRYPSRASFRNESFRGRGGNFGGGRGYGRSDFRNSGESSSRPRGSGGRGAEGYKRVEQNGSGTTSRQGAPK